MEDLDHNTWNKLVRDSEKVGYREGISDGREKNFQESFDEGYKQGFSNGFQFGRLKAITKIKNDDALKALPTRRGNCVICKDPTVKNQSNSFIIEKQTIDTNTEIETIRNKYKIND